MEDLNNTSVPLFKKIDREIFGRIDKFKLSPSYNGIQDFYNGLEEDQQKVFKAVTILLLILLPIAFLGTLLWQNNAIKEDLGTRVALVAKANEIIGQSQGLQDVSPQILSNNPIDGESMMTSRLSNLLSASGVDLSKFQVRDFKGDMISSNVMRSEADFSFNNLSTDELMNAFTSMIQREKFKIESVEIKRNADTNLLQGKFHAIHFSNAAKTEEEE